MLEGYKMFVIVYKSRKTGAEYIHKVVGKTEEEAKNKFEREYRDYYDIVKIYSYHMGR